MHQALYNKLIHSPLQVVAKMDGGHNDDWGDEELGDDLLPMG